MHTEIERKFIVHQIPTQYQNQTPLHYERYYLYIDSEVELRVQKKGSKYEMERKTKTGELSRDTEKLQISEGEYTALIKNCSKSIIRNSYILENPQFSIKEYLGNHKGLIRAEFEFNSTEEAEAFIPPEWCGEEITHTQLGRDSKLVQLTNQEFNIEIQKYLKS